MKQGWDKKTFGEVLDVLRNGVNCKQDKKGIGEKISRIESISSGEFDVDRVGYTNLKEEEKAKYKLEFGDILFSHINSPIHVGKTAIFKSDDEIYHGVNLLLMRPKPLLDKTYFEHYLKYLYQNGYWKGLCKQSVNQASVNQQDINKVEISFPKSLPEQQQIVSILDEVFSAIERSRKNAEKNLLNAKELFESYLQGVFEKKGDGWEEKKLGEVIEYDKNQNIHKGLPYVGLEHIESNSGRFIGSLEPQVVKSSTFYFNDQHVLYGRLRPYLNKVLLPDFEGHCSTEIFPIKVGKQITREFLFYWLIAGSTVKKIDSTWTGARMPRANMNQVLEFDFAFPPLQEQQTIVRQLDALRAETQKLEALYKKKIADLDELKKSILQKAFAGELKLSALGFVGLKEDRIFENEEDKNKIQRSSNPKNPNSDKKEKV